jgi:hypothetical protein
MRRRHCSWIELALNSLRAASGKLEDRLEFACPLPDGKTLRTIPSVALYNLEIFQTKQRVSACGTANFICLTVPTQVDKVLAVTETKNLRGEFRSTE